MVGRWWDYSPLSVMRAKPSLPTLCSSPTTSHEPDEVGARWERGGSWWGDDRGGGRGGGRGNGLWHSSHAPRAQRVCVCGRGKGGGGEGASPSGLSSKASSADRKYESFACKGSHGVVRGCTGVQEGCRGARGVRVCEGM